MSPHDDANEADLAEPFEIALKLGRLYTLVHEDNERSIASAKITQVEIEGMTAVIESLDFDKTSKQLFESYRDASKSEEEEGIRRVVGECMLAEVEAKNIMKEGLEEAGVKSDPALKAHISNVYFETVRRAERIKTEKIICVKKDHASRLRQFQEEHLLPGRDTPEGFQNLQTGRIATLSNEIRFIESRHEGNKLKDREDWNKILQNLLVKTCAIDIRGLDNPYEIEDNGQKLFLLIQQLQAAKDTLIRANSYHLLNMDNADDAEDEIQFEKYGLTALYKGLPYKLSLHQGFLNVYINKSPLEDDQLLNLYIHRGSLDEDDDSMFVATTNAETYTLRKSGPLMGRYTKQVELSGGWLHEYVRASVARVQGHDEVVDEGRNSSKRSLALSDSDGESSSPQPLKKPKQDIKDKVIEHADGTISFRGETFICTKIGDISFYEARDMPKFLRTKKGVCWSLYSYVHREPIPEVFPKGLSLMLDNNKKYRYRSVGLFSSYHTWYEKIDEKWTLEIVASKLEEDSKPEPTHMFTAKLRASAPVGGESSSSAPDTSDPRSSPFYEDPKSKNIWCFGIEHHHDTRRGITRYRRRGPGQEVQKNAGPWSAKIASCLVEFEKEKPCPKPDAEQVTLDDGHTYTFCEDYSPFDKCWIRSVLVNAKWLLVFTANPVTPE